MHEPENKKLQDVTGNNVCFITLILILEAGPNFNAGFFVWGCIAKVMSRPYFELSFHFRHRGRVLSHSIFLSASIWMMVRSKLTEWWVTKTLLIPLESKRIYKSQDLGKEDIGSWKLWGKKPHNHHVASSVEDRSWGREAAACRPFSEALIRALRQRTNHSRTEGKRWISG